MLEMCSDNFWLMLDVLEIRNYHFPTNSAFSKLMELRQPNYASAGLLDELNSFRLNLTFS